jgi:tRNA (guanine-N7-)-methyltransferase
MYHIIPNRMRSKKRKFREVKDFNNVVEWNDPEAKDKLKTLFGKYADIVLELGCGKGEYTLELAKKYPETLFLGIDIQGERIWRGAKDALESKINNAYFLRTQIENINEFIPKKSVSSIWITFPDPFPKDRHAKKRLTSPRFLKIYKKLLKKGGVVHLKTDSGDLYNYTKEIVGSSNFKIQKDIEDIYLEGLSIDEDINNIQTTFEIKYLREGRSIKYLRFG